ncbi:Microtubule-associated protein 70-5 [Vitis vinifera]|nr:Microtubule-associated protein 70-5 [Vitis vinifera]
MKSNTDMHIDKFNNDTAVSADAKIKGGAKEETQNVGSAGFDSEDMVSAFLYDRLQREVINLRKSCEVKNNTLTAKDDEIKMLMRKVDALSKAIEVESKKIKREAAAREKEAISTKADENKKIRNTDSSKRRVAKASS